MPAFSSILDVIPIVRVHRARDALAYEEAIAILRANADDEAAYRLVSDLARRDRSKSDLEAAKLYARVAVGIAADAGSRVISR